LTSAAASGHDAAQAVGHGVAKDATTDAATDGATDATIDAATDGVHTFELADAVCQAVLFLADANTITGSILLADGGAHVHRAASPVSPPVSLAANPSRARSADWQGVASMSDTVPEIASDPHDD
jgi:hypothetical protein